MRLWWESAFFWYAVGIVSAAVFLAVVALVAIIVLTRKMERKEP